MIISYISISQPYLKADMNGGVSYDKFIEDPNLALSYFLAVFDNTHISTAIKCKGSQTELFWRA